MDVVMGQRHDGEFGWAQEVSLVDHPAVPTQVASWFMQLPNQGIGYDNFILGIVSLDEVPGVPPPVLRYPEAEYELVVLGLNPDLQPAVDNADTWQSMSPLNVSEQFHGISREQVVKIANTLALACTRGQLVGETQMVVRLFDGSPTKMMFIKQAVDMWRNALDKLVEHEQTGGLHASAN